MPSVFSDGFDHYARLDVEFERELRRVWDFRDLFLRDLDEQILGVTKSTSDKKDTSPPVKVENLQPGWKVIKGSLFKVGE